jgi:hypothetical protein
MILASMIALSDNVPENNHYLLLGDLGICAASVRFHPMFYIKGLWKAMN